jgi:hypothetical protein
MQDKLLEMWNVGDDEEDLYEISYYVEPREGRYEGRVFTLSFLFFLSRIEMSSILLLLLLPPPLLLQILFLIFMKLISRNPPPRPRILIERENYTNTKNNTNDQK